MRKGRSAKRRASGSRGKASAGSRAQKPAIDFAGLSLDDVPERVWSRSRAGARAGRGFHYQDLVGAWLCGQVLANRLAVERIVPEGFEDLSCEGPDAWQVQVKSRQERVGDFSIGETVSHILKMFQTRSARGASSQPLFLVLERPVSGCEAGGWGVVLGDLPVDHALRVAVGEELLGRDVDQSMIKAIQESVGVCILPWRAAADQIRRIVADRYDVLPAAIEPVVLTLRDAVAECVDTNAAVTFPNRVGLDRTRIERIVADAIRLMDLDALQQALTSGACEPVDFDEPLYTESFYEGVDVQPGHIAAGLPAPRPALTGQVAEAVERGEVVLVTGPSGVGKSTVMWAAAYSTRHILWYRVRRLSESDVEPIARLTEAARPSARSPVGLVIDAVGQAGARAWDSLCRRLAGKTGVVLLGSARSEDLLPLETLAQSSVISVHLDEEVAAEIHTGLLERGATALAHWKHAYDHAHGLTLEFTHLLTRGRRLSDVISTQVQTRVRDHRGTELAVLALVSTAHQWGAALSLRCVQEVLGVSDIEFRAALERLTGEHLLRSTGTILTGLHQLRSAALSHAVHDQPPPALVETVDMILPLLDDSDLLPFVVGALIAHSDLDTTVLDHLVTRLADTTAVDTWTTALHTLRVVDFHRQAVTWADICRRHRVPPALRQGVVLQVFAGNEPLPNSRREVMAAIAEISTVRDIGSPLRDLALARLGPERIAATLARSTNSEEAARFLAVIALTDIDLAAHLALALDEHDAPLTGLLPTLTIEDLASILGAARSVSADLAILLMQAAGGPDAVISRLFAFSPWLIDLKIEDQDGTVVAWARVLHVSDHLVGDIERVVIELSKLLARCFPHCQMVDIQAVIPGGQPLKIGDVTLAKRFPVTLDVAPTVVAWNRLRSQIATVAAGTSDPTIRVQNARALLVDVKRYVEILTRMWLTGDRGQATRTAFVQLVTDLEQRAENLTLAINRADLNVGPGGITPHRMDSLSSLISGIVTNLTSRLAVPSPAWPSIAAYVGDSLRRILREVGEQEHWHLIGADPPAEIDQLDRLLLDLHAVLAELAWGESTQLADLMASPNQHRGRDPLRAAAVTARTAANRHVAKLKRAYRQALRARGVHARFVTRSPDDAAAYEWPPVRTAVLIDIPDFSAWIHAHGTVQELLPREIDPQRLGVQPLLIPQLNNRPIAALARYLSNILKPDTGRLFAQWRDTLGEPYPTPLTDAFVAAVESLTIISSLGTLRASRPDEPSHVDLIQHEIDNFHEVLNKIDELRPEDTLVQQLAEYLRELAGRVESEVNDDRATLESKTVAAEISEGALGWPNEFFNQVSGVSALTVQWDISPEAANQFALAVTGEED